MLEYVAVLSPFFGALITGLFGRQIGADGVKAATCAFMLAAAGSAVALFVQMNMQGGAAHVAPLFSWMSWGDLTVSWGLKVDQLSALMILVVNVVSAAVHVYSLGYMSEDPAQPRFMTYLSLFTFAMLMLVTAPNFAQLFFGWEGVGLASYLLIGFWNEKDSANAAAVKAFVVNRVGDFGLALGIFAVFAVFGTLDFDAVFAAAGTKTDLSVSFLGHTVGAIPLICALLFVGAVGKSAQLGLHTWLPDAMEGPTPVSALIHAATMVTAGVFLVARCSPLFEHAPDVRAFIAVLGGLTALVAATIALTQFDIKRVIAYSTMSQLGYMFFALGVSAYGAAMFHLFTHAFFKALLFLGAGSVIHALSGEQDMRRMGGVWRAIPFTYAMMWVGNLALAGVPFFAGFYSKDLILESAFAAHSTAGTFAFWCGIAAAFLTAFYSWRLLFLSFHGQPRADEKVMAHVHESPLTMTLPLAVLAIGAVFAGWIFFPSFGGEARAAFFGSSLFVLSGNDTVGAAHHVPSWVKTAPLAVGAAGIFLAWVFYIHALYLPAVVAGAFSRLHALLSNKWYFDEIYDAVFVRPAVALGRVLWKTGDGKVIDGLGPDGVAAAVARASGRARGLQSGYVYTYAFAMLAGAGALVAWRVLTVGG